MRQRDHVRAAQMLLMHHHVKIPWCTGPHDMCPSSTLHQAHCMQPRMVTRHHRGQRARLERR